MALVQAKQNFEECNRPKLVREPVRVWAARNAYALIAGCIALIIVSIVQITVEVLL